MTRHKYSFLLRWIFKIKPYKKLHNNNSRRLQLPMSIPIMLSTVWTKEPSASTWCSMALPFSTLFKTFLMLWSHTHSLLSSKQTWQLTHCTFEVAPCSSFSFGTWLRCEIKFDRRHSQFLIYFDILSHMLFSQFQQVLLIKFSEFYGTPARWLKKGWTLPMKYITAGYTYNGIKVTTVLKVKNRI